MRNFAVKFAILCRRLDEKVTPQDFLDLSPEETLRVYQSALSPQEQGVVLFGFTDEAILAILDQEMAVDMERNRLVFRKAFLDATSIQRANGALRTFIPEEEELVERLATWLFEATRNLYRRELSPARLEDIKEEYRACFRFYAQKYDHVDSERLHVLCSSTQAMKDFVHSLVIDAMFKADASKVLFGEASSYHQAWVRKQMFRLMLSRTVEQYLLHCAA